MPKSATHADIALRRVVRLVALLNFGYFGVEFAVARVIGSVSLFADSIDFLEDASVNFLILAALGWSAVLRARVGMALAGILLIPGLAAVWTAWEKFNVPAPPEPLPLSLAGAGALAVNLSCAFMLARYRAHRGSLTRAAFLSARNDAPRQPRHYRGGADDGLPVGLCMAGFDCRVGNRRPERGCSARSLDGGP